MFKNMKIGKFVSTIILITSFCSIYLFALIFCIYINSNSQILSTLKDSLSTTSSFFGGIATLVAAYIASQLFNDWRDEKEFEIVKDSSLELLQAALNLNSTIESIMVIVFEFENFTDTDEYENYIKTCNDLSKNFLNNIIDIKNKNNKYHGLVLDFENDEKFFSQNDLQLASDLFKEIHDNVLITVKNYNNNTNIELNEIDYTAYNNMMRIKIKTLNKKCKPKNHNI